MFGIAYAFFKIQDKLTKGGIRSSEEDELAGLDLAEMGVLAYPEFSGAPYGSGPGGRAGASKRPRKDSAEEVATS